MTPYTVIEREKEGSVFNIQESKTSYYILKCGLSNMHK